MTKDEIIKELALSLGIPQSKASQLYENFQKKIIQLLAQGNIISISNFGSFSTDIRSSYIGRIPKTQQKIRIPMKKVLTFKASPQLKDQINEKPLNS